MLQKIGGEAGHAAAIQRLARCRVAAGMRGRGPHSRLHMTTPAPFNALIREVYWIPRELMDPKDPKPGRPAVVIEEAHGPAARLRVVSRTRDEKRGGVEHPPQADLHLKDRGWFSDDYWVDAWRLVPGVADYRGLLAATTFEAVLEEYL